MTNIRNSQLTDIAVVTGASNIRVSQLVNYAVNANGPSTVRVSQLACYAVVANGRDFKALGPVVGLGCWTPCANLAYNQNEEL